MDVDTLQAHAASNVDDWLPRFSPATSSGPGVFPFTARKTQSIESRRARMSDLLIFDVLLIRGGIRSPDMLFPPSDWASLKRLLDTVNESTYDVLKKDCLVYILLKWTWDVDPVETNPGWDVRFLQDRCIAPQFAALADAYWLLDTGTRLPKAVSILSDARLNRDYVSKILQALSLSSSPASSTSDVHATATLVVKYVRTAKPLLTEPDDIDLYALSLAQLSFMDTWTYQRSFPDGSDTRERLLGKIIAWCLMPMPKQEPLAQLIAFSLSPYEQSYLYSFALPSQLPTSSSGVHVTPSRPLLSSQAISILQDLLCVRAIQSGDHIRAIKLDRQFSSVFPSSDSSSSIVSQSTLPVRETIDRKSIIQDLFATLPPAERALLEDEIGKVAAGVRANTQSTFTPRQGASTSVRRPLVAEASLSASWEDLGASPRIPVPSVSASVSPPKAGAGLTGKASPAPTSTIGKVDQLTFSTSASASPFALHVHRPVFGRQAPPTPKFTAFGSPIPSTTDANVAKGVVAERIKTLFSNSATSAPSGAGKPAPRVSLFDTTGSAKSAANAFYKPPSAPATKTLIDVGGALAGSAVARNPEQDTIVSKQNGKTPGGENGGDDVSMRSGSDVEVAEEDHRNESDRESKMEGDATDEDEEDAGNFLTYDKSDVADLTLRTPHVDETMDEDHEAGAELEFSVFSGSRNAAQNGNAGRHRTNGASGNEKPSHASPPRRARPSLSREGDKTLNTSVGSSTPSRSRAPPGAFNPEEDEDQHDEDGIEDVTQEEDDHVIQTPPIQSPRRSTCTRGQSETSPRSFPRSPPQRNLKNTSTTTGGTSQPSRRSGRTSSGLNLSQTIPGALMDDNDEHEQDDADHTDAHGDVDTEVDEQEEEDDAIAPLPSHHPSRRTRSSGFFGAATKSKPSPKPTAVTKAAGTANVTTKSKRTRPSEPKTPTRRSSRLSMASSTSPDHNDVMSPIKGRKSTGSKGSIAGDESGTVATRYAKRKR